jgi:hypothetical protein
MVIAYGLARKIFLWLKKNLITIFFRFHEVTILAIDDANVTVEFDVDDIVTVSNNKIFPIRKASDKGTQFVVGQEVDVFYKTYGNSWWQGVIKKLNGEKATVHFLSGETHQNIDISRFREHLK